MWIQVYLNLAPWTAWLLCLWMRRTDSNASLEGERLVLLKRWSLNGVKMDSVKESCGPPRGYLSASQSNSKAA